MLMVPFIVLGLLTFVPLLLVLVLRSNAATAFMSVCMGSVLGLYATTDMVDFVTSFTPIRAVSSESWVQMALILVPLILALLLTSKSVKGSKQLLNFLPALATGLLTALLVVPLLPADVQKAITATDAWDSLQNMQTAVVIVGAVFSVLFLASTKHAGKGDEKRK